MPGNDDNQPMTDAERQELEALMKLSIREVNHLPDNKKEIVYRELMRRMANSAYPKIIDTIPIIAQAYNAIKQSVLDTLSPFLGVSMPDVWELIRKGIERFEVLEPYMDAELAEHPEIEDQEFSVLMEAAERRARADGVTVPPLPLEQEYPEAASTSPAEKIDRIAALAIRPNYSVMPAHKLMSALKMATRSPEAITQIIVDVSKKGARNRAKVTCILSYEGDNLQIAGRQPFTEYDRCVYSAVVSLYVAGNRVVTCDMIWRAMTGKTEQEQATPAQQAAVTKSLDKMRFMRAVIDCSQEFKMRRISLDGNNLNGGGYDDNLLHLSITWVKTATGKVIRAYEILSAPVLYKYSAAVKQLQTVDIKLLDVKKLDSKGKPTTHSLEYTERRVVIKGYLLRRIEGMKGNNSLNSHCIALRDYDKGGQPHEGLYSIAGSPELSQPMPEDMTDVEKNRRKDNARNIRNDAEAMLKYWTATGYIKGYSIYKDKGVSAGFEIKL